MTSENHLYETFQRYQTELQRYKQRKQEGGKPVADGKCPHGMSSPAWCRSCMKSKPSKKEPDPPQVIDGVQTRTIGRRAATFHKNDLHSGAPYTSAVLTNAAMQDFDTAWMRKISKSRSQTSTIEISAGSVLSICAPQHYSVDSRLVLPFAEQQLNLGTTKFYAEKYQRFCDVLDAWRIENHFEVCPILVAHAMLSKKDAACAACKAPTALGSPIYKVITTAIPITSWVCQSCAHCVVRYAHEHPDCVATRHPREFQYKLAVGGPGGSSESDRNVRATVEVIELWNSVKAMTHDRSPLSSYSFTTNRWHTNNPDRGRRIRTVPRLTFPAQIVQP